MFALPLASYLRLARASAVYHIVQLWCAVRLKESSLRLGRFDGVGRLLFALWIAGVMLEADLPVLWLFLVPELLWGVAQWWAVDQASGSSTPRAAFISAAPMRSSRGG